MESGSPGTETDHYIITIALYRTYSYNYLIPQHPTLPDSQVSEMDAFADPKVAGGDLAVRVLVYDMMYAAFFILLSIFYPQPCSGSRFFFGRWLPPPGLYPLLETWAELSPHSAPRELSATAGGSRSAGEREHRGPTRPNARTPAPGRAADALGTL